MSWLQKVKEIKGTTSRRIGISFSEFNRRIISNRPTSSESVTVTVFWVVRFDGQLVHIQLSTVLTDWCNSNTTNFAVVVFVYRFYYVYRQVLSTLYRDTI